jgi:hypothetical protein
MHSVNENLKAKIQACLIGDEGTDLAYLINLLSLEAYQDLTIQEVFDKELKSKRWCEEHLEKVNF